MNKSKTPEPSYAPEISEEENLIESSSPNDEGNFFHVVKTSALCTSLLYHLLCRMFFFFE